ncbi:MAG: CYTH domain-containing protein [Alphaproteobacteria bacterium]|nr:MAG: CYTH domain-containing protein [Alphaproteobacteria bacterium]
MSPAREVELKLEVPADSLTRLSRSSLLQAARRKPSKPEILISVYFDTDKLKLRNKGLSLRVRRVGRRHVQTIKQESDESAVLFARNEWEHQIGGRQRSSSPSTRERSKQVVSPRHSASWNWSSSEANRPSFSSSRACWPRKCRSNLRSRARPSAATRSLPARSPGRSRRHRSRSHRIGAGKPHSKLLPGRAYASLSPISQPRCAATPRACTRCGSRFGACARQSHYSPTCFVIRRRRR